MEECGLFGALGELQSPLIHKDLHWFWRELASATPEATERPAGCRHCDSNKANAKG